MAGIQTDRERGNQKPSVEPPGLRLDGTVNVFLSVSLNGPYLELLPRQDVGRGAAQKILLFIFSASVCLSGCLSAP